MASLTSGRFPAKVLWSRMGKTPTGTREWRIMLDINPNGTAEDPKGQLIAFRYFTTDGSMEKRVEEMKVLGYDPAANGWNIAPLAQGEQSPIVGAECQAVLEVDEYQGERRLKVAWINALGGGDVQNREEMGADDLGGLGNELRAWAEGGAAQAARPPGQEVSPGEIGDTPF